MEKDRVTTEWLMEFLEQKTRHMVQVARAKNADYAGASTDPFGNFRHVEDLGIASTEQGFLTRMTDKLCRVATFVKKGSLVVKDESVQDTLLDLSNYSLLLAAYLESKRRPVVPALPVTGMSVVLPEAFWPAPGPVDEEGSFGGPLTGEPIIKTAPKKKRPKKK